MTSAEKTAQEFIIAASKGSPDEAIAKVFVGKMRRGVEEGKLQKMNCAEPSERLQPGSDQCTVNFRTGTFVVETTEDLLAKDYFRNTRSPATSAALMLSFKRSLRQSNSSPSPTTNPSSSLLQPTHVGSNRPVLRIQSDYAAGRAGTRMHFFDVVSAAARRAHLESPILIRGSTAEGGSSAEGGKPARKGYIRRGLREKLAQKAEEARGAAHTRTCNTDHHGNIQGHVTTAMQGHVTAAMQGHVNADQLASPRHDETCTVMRTNSAPTSPTMEEDGELPFVEERRTSKSLKLISSSSTSPKSDLQITSPCSDSLSSKAKYSVTFAET